MTKRFCLFLIAFLLAPTGCSSKADDQSIETKPLTGNGEAGELDFLNPIFPTRGNAPPALVNGVTAVAITRWIDVTRCTTQSDFNRGEHQVCPGNPSMVSLRLIEVSCDDDACDVRQVRDSSRPELIVLDVTTRRAGARLRVRVGELATRIVHEDTFVLAGTARDGGDAGAEASVVSVVQLDSTVPDSPAFREGVSIDGSPRSTVPLSGVVSVILSDSLSCSSSATPTGKMYFGVDAPKARTYAVGTPDDSHVLPAFMKKTAKHAGDIEFATSGSVVISRVTATTISGSLDLAFSDGQVSGVFEVPLCP